MTSTLQQRLPLFLSELLALPPDSTAQAGPGAASSPTRPGIASFHPPTILTSSEISKLCMFWKGVMRLSNRLHTCAQPGLVVKRQAMAWPTTARLAGEPPQHAELLHSDDDASLRFGQTRQAHPWQRAMLCLAGYPTMQWFGIIH